MKENHDVNGKTTLTPDVIFTIAKMTALSVEGVDSLSKAPSGIDRLFKQPFYDGVKILVEDGLVYLDIYVVLKANYNVREVSRNIQMHISRAISEMIGMEIGHINIHIENIRFEGEI